MAAGTVTGVYAAALLELATERNRLGPVVECCRDLAGAITPAAVAALDDPRVGKVRAKQAIRAAWSAVAPEVLDLLCLLVDRDRLAEASGILAEAVRSADLAAGVVRVAVTTASPLSAASSERLGAALRRVLGAGVVVNAGTDARLIGGITIRVGDTYVDGSIARKLDEARRRALDAPLGDLWEGRPTGIPA